MEKLLSFSPGNLRDITERYGNILIALAFALAGLMPIILESTASAAQMTSRSVTVASSQPNADGVNYTFAFTTATTADIQSMVFQFCDTALGACVLPGTDGTPTAAEKLDVSHVTAAPGAFTGTTATAFAEHTGADTGGCTESDGGSGVATMYCVTRTETTDETAGAKTFIINSISNPIIPSGNFEEIYVRITTYSDTAFATAVDTGTVAAAIVNQLTVSGRVNERLEFCVFALDDTSGSSSTVGAANAEFPNSCAANEANDSTSVDIGVVDHLSITRSPVDNSPPTVIGNDRFGAAMMSTNAANGITLTYYAAAATTGTNELRAFRIPGTTCNASGTDTTDSCFVSGDDAADDPFVIGTERFGMQIACVANSTSQGTSLGSTSNLGKNSGGTYTSGDGTAGSYNAFYDGDRSGGSLDDITADDNCENDPGDILNDDFSWRDSATAQALISSVKVVDDEMVKFRHGATASATTPSGSYTVASTFIATPVF